MIIIRKKKTKHSGQIVYSQMGNFYCTQVYTCNKFITIIYGKIMINSIIFNWSGIWILWRYKEQVFQCRHASQKEVVKLVNSWNMVISLCCRRVLDPSVKQELVFLSSFLYSLLYIFQILLISYFISSFKIISLSFIFLFLIKDFRISKSTWHMEINTSNQNMILFSLVSFPYLILYFLNLEKRFIRSSNVLILS